MSADTISLCDTSTTWCPMTADLRRLPHNTMITDIKSSNGLSKAEFLGLQSTFSPAVTFNILDKKSDTARFPGGICRYPHWLSNVPQHFCTGSIIGSLTYALSNSSSWSRFITAGRNFMDEFQSKGYPARLIRSTIHRFATLHLENTRVSPQRLTTQLLKKQRTPSRVGFGTMLPSYPSAMKHSSSSTRHPPDTPRVSFYIPPSTGILKKAPSRIRHTSPAQQQAHRCMNRADWTPSPTAPPSAPQEQILHAPYASINDPGYPPRQNMPTDASDASGALGRHRERDLGYTARHPPAHPHPQEDPHHRQRTRTPASAHAPPPAHTHPRQRTCTPASAPAPPPAHTHPRQRPRTSPASAFKPAPLRILNVIAPKARRKFFRLFLETKI